MIGLLGWVVIVGVGLAWEFVALSEGDTPTWPTLTRVIREHAPKWAIVVGIALLWWHFLG